MDGLRETVNELLGYDSEREWFEFKKNWFEPRQLGEYISALSNSAALEGREAAYFVWGVDDRTHEPAGTDFDCNRNVKGEPLKHFLARRLSPDLNLVFDEILIGGKRLVVLTIPAAKSVPASFAGRRYIRIGSSKEDIRKYPEKEFRLFETLRHGPPTMENTPSEYQDPSFKKLLIYYGANGIKLNRATFKKNLGLLTGEGKYNLLAQMLSDDSHVPIRVALFSGRTKADRLYAVREFGNQCLLYSLDEVLRYGDVLNVIQTDESSRVVERKEVPLFDGGAFREAVVNAFVHNSWVGGNEPMIAVFSDRIEILSRGPLPPGQTREGFFAGESIPVNRKLSDIFLQLQISEKTGRGVPTITREYGREAFEFRENAIVVTLPFRRIGAGWSPEIREEEGAAGAGAAQPGRTPLRILAEIRKNPGATKPQLARKLRVCETTVDNGIRALKKAGRICRVGANRNGHWRILK